MLAITHHLTVITNRIQILFRNPLSLMPRLKLNLIFMIPIDISLTSNSVFYMSETGVETTASALIQCTSTSNFCKHVPYTVVWTLSSVVGTLQSIRQSFFGGPYLASSSCKLFIFQSHKLVYGPPRRPLRPLQALSWCRMAINSILLLRLHWADAGVCFFLSVCPSLSLLRTIAFCGRFCGDRRLGAVKSAYYLRGFGLPITNDIPRFADNCRLRPQKLTESLQQHPETCTLGDSHLPSNQRDI